MSRIRYKSYLKVGDDAIPRKTAERYQLGTADRLHEDMDIVQHDEDMELDGSVSCSISRTRDKSSICRDSNEIEDFRASDDESAGFRSNNDLLDILLEGRSDKSSRTNTNPKNLQEFIKSKHFFRTIETPVDKSLGEVFLLILKFSLSNNLSVTGMTNLFKLVNTIFAEQILPESKYIMDNLLNTNTGLEFHAVCHECSSYVGIFEEVKNVTECPSCQTELDLSSPSKSSFFVLIDPSSQVSDLLDMHWSYYRYILNSRPHERGHLKDVYDGNIYQEFVTWAKEQGVNNYATAVLNTDGAPKFEGSQYSIWPMYLMLNELPIQERMDNLITCGLWFHRKKPDMSVFLSPFVDMMNRKSNQGITVTDRGENIHLYIIACCVDSVARAPMQGIKQFNGKYGCNWCLHPGQFEGSMRYPVLLNEPLLRDDKVTVEEMLNIDYDNPLHGIKFPSALINLKFFKIISSFTPDILHILEGVTDQLMNYYAASLSNDDLVSLDLKLKQISAPNQISRLTRPFSIRSDWKAREWENFLLYYSVPIFSSILNKKFFDHLVLLVESLYILLLDDITIDQLNRADSLLYEFVAKTEQYFGLTAMTFNIHQLLHISRSVLNFGPLWAHSTYCFESENQDLLKYIKCARGVPQQICRFVSIKHHTKIVQNHVYSNVSPLIKYYCDEVLSARVKDITKLTKITYMGQGCSVNRDIENALHLSKGSLCFQKMIKEGCVYESYKRNKRRSNNSFAQIQDGRYIRIKEFIVNQRDNKEYSICNFLQTGDAFGGACTHLKVVNRIEVQDRVIETNVIKIICVIMEVNNRTFICALPNLLHY